ncbi:putative Alpha-ribazole phosphatase [Balamuthia mandrillaris]
MEEAMAAAAAEHKARPEMAALTPEEMKAEYERLKVEVEAFEFVHPSSGEQQREQIKEALQKLEVVASKERLLDKKELFKLGQLFRVPLSEEESAVFTSKRIPTDNKDKADLEEFCGWCVETFPTWSGDKLDFIRMKLRATALPLERVKGVKKLSSTAFSHWAKLRGVLKVARYYRTYWKPAPRTEKGWQEVQQAAREQGKLINRVTFVRHGQSTSNAGWDVHGCEPFIFDAELTELGRQQAAQRATKMLEQKPIQLVVTSPLTRAVQTCDIVFGNLKGKVPFIMHPLCREQMSGADDLGRLKEDLKKEFEGYDMGLVPEGFWWYIPTERRVEGETLEEHYHRYKEANCWTEPGRVLAERIRQFEAWIVERPEIEIGVVSHGNFIERMCNIPRIANGDQFILEVDPLKPINPSEED